MYDKLTHSLLPLCRSHSIWLLRSLVAGSSPTAAAADKKSTFLSPNKLCVVVDPYNHKWYQYIYSTWKNFYACIRLNVLYLYFQHWIPSPVAIWKSTIILWATTYWSLCFMVKLLQAKNTIVTIRSDFGDKQAYTYTQSIFKIYILQLFELFDVARTKFSLNLTLEIEISRAFISFSFICQCQGNFFCAILPCMYNCVGSCIPLTPSMDSYYVTMAIPHTHKQTQMWYIMRKCRESIVT